MKTKVEKNTSFMLNILVIIMINIAGLFFFQKCDLTSDNSYSLSKVSKDVISELEEPVSIKIFISKDLPAEESAVANYFEDLMEQYKDYSNSNFSFKYYDMSEKSDQEIAHSFGVFPTTMRDFVDDKLQVKNAYLGFAIVHGDLVEKFAKIDSTFGLENDITSSIQKMTSKINSLLSMKNDEYIHMTLYVTEALKDLRIHGLNDLNQTLEVIYEKVNKSNFEKIKYHIVDPSKENMVGTVSEKYGLAKIQYQDPASSRKNPVTKEALLGIVIEYKDKFKSIPIDIMPTPLGNFLQKLDNIEDQVNETINFIISKNPAVAYITGHGEKDLNDQRAGAANFKKINEDMYEFKSVDLTKNDFPADVKTLIVNGAKKRLTDEELLKIDQFIMKGGSALFMVDSFNEINLQGNNQMAMMNQGPIYLPISSGIENLIKAYGVSVEKNYVLDKNSYKAAQQNMEIPLYHIPMVDDSFISDESVITKNIKRLFFMKASSVKLDKKFLEKNSIKSSVLVTSSDESWKTSGKINLNPMMIQPPSADKMSKENLAVLLEGKFSSAFKDKLPESFSKASDKSKLNASEILKTSVKPGKVVVIGTSEITTGQLIDDQGKSPVGIFLHNIIDYLNDNVYAPEMRSKGFNFNPLEKTSKTTRSIIKVINIAGLPLMVVLVGIGVWFMRRKRQLKIKELFSREVSNE